jgi:hypothetical protein
VFPPPVKGRPPIIILILNLKHIKRSGGKKKPCTVLPFAYFVISADLSRKKFAFCECENLICCPVLFTLALALADNAFKNKFTSLKQIYDLVVPSDIDRIRLK